MAILPKHWHVSHTDLALGNTGTGQTHRNVAIWHLMVQRSIVKGT